MDEFIAFADNSHIVIADYESRLSRLQAMIAIRDQEGSCPLLNKWIADAHKRLEVMDTLYSYALVARKMPMDELRTIWAQIKDLKQ